MFALERTVDVHRHVGLVGQMGSPGPGPAIAEEGWGKAECERAARNMGSGVRNVQVGCGLLTLMMGWMVSISPRETITLLFFFINIIQL